MMTPQTFLERIADGSRSIHRPGNKRLAWEALRDVIGTLQDRKGQEGSQQFSELECALARLYAHFLPRPPRRPKTYFQWCALATAGKEDLREFLRYVFIDGERIMGSNGHLLHIAPNLDGRAPGYYNLAGDRLYDGTYATYPDVDRVIPRQDQPCKQWRLLRRDELPVQAYSDDIACYWLPDHRTVGRAVAIDKRYWDAAVSMDGDVVSVLCGEADAPIKLELSEGRVAVIMPMQSSRLKHMAG